MKLELSREKKKSIIIGAFLAFFMLFLVAMKFRGAIAVLLLHSPQGEPSYGGVERDAEGCTRTIYAD